MIDISQKISTLEQRVGEEYKNPLFAQLASYYLEVNRASDALAVCDAGLAHYPFFTTAHLIKGKALMALNMNSEARRELEFVYQFLPSNKVVADLLKQIPQDEEEILTLQDASEPEQIVEETIPPVIETAPHEYKIPWQPQAPAEPDYGLEQLKKPAYEPEPEQEIVDSSEQTFEQIQETPAPTSFFDAITTQVPKTEAEDPFGFGPTTAPIEEPITVQPATFSGFDGQETEPATFDQNFEQSQEPFSGFGAITTEGVTTEPSVITPSEEEEVFEEYVARVKNNLQGENTISLEDYFENKKPDMPILPSGIGATVSNIIETPQVNLFSMDVTNTPSSNFDLTSSQQEHQDSSNEAQSSFGMLDLPESPYVPDTPFEPSPSSTSASIELPISSDMQNQIEEIAAKLQTAKKITPVIDLSKQDNSKSKTEEEDTPVSMGFVTPTLAEIYAKQGWYDDAIKAYKALVKTKPNEKDRFEKRISELEALKSKAV